MLARSILVLCLLASVPVWAASITGQVTVSGGAPIANYNVTLLSQAGGKGWAAVQTLQTNASGYYTFITGAGDYLVRVDPPDSVPSYCLYARRYFDSLAPNTGGTTESAADVLTLGVASVFTGINFPLPTVGAIGGRVMQGGVGRNGVQVRLEGRSDAQVHVDTVSATLAGNAGSFSLCGVDPGNYLFWIHEPSGLTEDLIAPGPYTVTSGSQLSSGSFVLTAIGTDPNEPNAAPATGTSVPDFTYSWNSNGAILTARGSDIDFYCLNARAGYRYVITSTTTATILGEPRSSPWMDPVVGWFQASPAQLLLSNDDDLLTPGSLNARLDTGVVPAAARYCVGVTSYGDPDFNGSGQQSAGRYAIHIESDVLFVDGFDSP